MGSAAQIVQRSAHQQTTAALLPRVAVHLAAFVFQRQQLADVFTVMSVWPAQSIARDQMAPCAITTAAASQLTMKLYANVPKDITAKPVMAFLAFLRDVATTVAATLRPAAASARRPLMRATGPATCVPPVLYTGAATTVTSSAQ